MGIGYGLDTREYKTAKELITDRPECLGKDGYYVLYPGGPDNDDMREEVYCDMTTDGGGWMLLARTHPSGSASSGTWGWQGAAVGNVRDYTQPYQLSWWNGWHKRGVTQFTEYAFGNRANVNNSAWGYFVYKRYSLNTDFITNDSQRGASWATLKSDLSVYGTTNAPGMQGAIGFPLTGTSNNIYYMRDCCGFAGYGVTPSGMSTTYCNNESVVYYSGPWCGGVSLDGAGNFLPNTYTSPAGYKYGGTNQCMIMVR